MGGFIMVNSIKITDYITEDLVDLDLKSKNREGILIELSELLEKSPNITGEEKDIYKALVDREKLCKYLFLHLLYLVIFPIILTTLLKYLLYFLTLSLNLLNLL